METAYGKSGQMAAYEVVQRELSRDEKILWVGQPDSGIKFQAEDIIMVPFSLFWAGIAFFWEYIALTSSAPFFFKLFGIPFVLIGAYMVFGRFIVASILRKHTFYGVTNQRIVIITDWFSKNVQSIMLPNVPDINLKTKGKGKGTISFGSLPYGTIFMSYTNWPAAKRTAPPSFFMIDGAREAYDIIKQAQLEASRPRQESDWSRTVSTYGHEEGTGTNTRAL